MLSLINIIWLIIVCITLYLFVKLFNQQHIPKGLKELPKTKGWPFIGVMLSSKEPWFAYLYKLKQQHGPIFKFSLGCREIIVVNTADMMNRTLKEMGTNFSGRWQNVIMHISNHKSGILFKDKEWWAIQRSFVLKVLRDFGLGKQRSQEIVNSECSLLLKEMEDSCGSVVSTRFLFPKYMVNVIAKLVMNVRFERSDLNFQSLTKIIEKHSQNRNFVITLNLMYPNLEYLSILSKFLLWCCGRDKETDESTLYINDIIAEHKKRFNPENDGEDLIDIFLKERHKLDINHVKNHTFTEWQLIRVVMELFAAGYETTSTTLSWSMILLAKHPEIQDKVHKEIIEQIGSSRVPTLIDKKSLVYTQAVMDEIFRVSSVVPLSIAHRVFENTLIDGYFIPKDSIVFPNIYGVHHDADSWEKPFEFYPEHFLTEIDGLLRYNPREDLMPFSIGKRQCLGESLARLEFFTFFTSILQRFKIRFAGKINDEEFQRITLGTNGTIRAPLNTDVIFELWQN